MASSLVSKAQDTSKDAKRGGSFLYSRNQEVFTFDIHLGLAGAIGNLPYSRLFTSKPGHLETEGWVFEGDMFESWELSPGSAYRKASAPRLTGLPSQGALLLRLVNIYGMRQPGLVRVVTPGRCPAVVENTPRPSSTTACGPWRRFRLT